MKSKTLYVGRPNVGDVDLFKKLVDDIFERRWFSNNGPLVQEFEKRLCEYLGVRHCITVCNATIGLQVVCHALDLKGEVIVPAYTFVATPHSVHWEGLTPVFADVDAKQHLLDVESVAALITPRTSAILGVHTWGQACHPGALQELADRHGLALYFDAAHAFGCRHGGKMIGNFGRCEVFSFHATKFFNTFEGGAVTTNDDALAARLRLMINFGFSGFDKVDRLGTNGKLSEIHAAMGLASFNTLENTIKVNRAHYEHYKHLLAALPGLRFFEYEESADCNYQYIVTEIDPGGPGITRDEVLSELQDNNIMARRYFFPGCHRMEPYRSSFPSLAGRLPVTEAICAKALVLPTGTAVDGEDIERVCQHIRRVLERG